VLLLAARDVTRGDVSWLQSTIRERERGGYPWGRDDEGGSPFSRVCSNRVERRWETCDVIR